MMVGFMPRFYAQTNPAEIHSKLTNRFKIERDTAAIAPMRFDSYQAPISQLITYGQPKPNQGPDDWPNYISELKLDSEHIPDLLRLVLDPAVAQTPSNHVEVWASLHAWRSLGQLRAQDAIDPLLKLLGNEADDWVTDEIPWVYALIGPAAIPALAKYLKSSSKDAWGRMTTVSCLRAIAELHQPAARQECIVVMTTQLAEYRRNPPELNGLLIAELIELKASTAAATIEQAYKTGCVDELMAGTWPACQVSLGLKAPGDFPEEAFNPQMPPELEDIKRLGKLGDMLAASEPPTSLSDAFPEQPLPTSKGFGNNGKRSGKSHKK